MKRRIYWNLCIIALAALLLAASVSLLTCYGFFVRQVQSDLKNECGLAAAGVENAPADEEFLTAALSAEKATRFTLIAGDGRVLYDSAAAADTLPNHLDRPEVAEALRTGWGEASRRSDTLGERTYYCAVRLSDGTVLRLARNAHSITGIFLGVLPVILGFALLIALGCAAAARILTRRIVEPLTAAGDHLDALPSGENEYDELAPFFTKISRPNSLIRQQLSEMKEERDTISLIMDHMQEGLVLIGPGKKILSVNRSAVRFLSSGERDCTGRSFLALTRNASLISAVEDALSGTPSSDVISASFPLPEEENSREIRYFASPVWTEDRVTGATLFLMDVTEQKKAERVRQEFSSNVSHELKTPLTSISGFAEMIQNGMVADPEKQREFGGLIYSEAQRLLTLIGDIMRLSQIEECQEEKPAVSVNLFTLAKGVASSLKPLAEKSGVTLTAEGRNVSATGDMGMLHEMIYNLAENAVKYNRPGGKVVLRAEESSGRAVLTVSDTGIGIPREHQDRIFERFYRVDKSRSKQTGGTGLGLSIVKHIVEYHGGSIRLESTEGQGTVVTVTL